MGSTFSCYMIPEGTRYAVYEFDGRVAIVDGPVRNLKPGRVAEKLVRHVAAEDEYLLVKFKDGQTELLQGPRSMYEHPLEHDSIVVKKAVRIAEQELIVVYKPIEGGAHGAGAVPVRRELIRGPSLYVPATVSEWMHEFVWTGTSVAERDPNTKAVKRVDGLRFTTLRTKPGKSYIDVECVRTKDNALVAVKTMIFFRFVSVEKMLDNTTDPFGDMINAVSADVIEWCATKTFDEFITATEALNTNEPYVHLGATLSKIGMELERVVFRGYEAPAALQRLHNSAIEKRTELALAREQEEEQQRLEDFKLQRETDRAAQQAQLELERTQHTIRMEAMTAEAEQLRIQQGHELELKRLREIKSIDKSADIGQYLIAKEGHVQPVVQCGTLMTSREASATGAPGRMVAKLQP